MSSVVQTTLLTPQEANAALAQGFTSTSQIIFDAEGTRKVQLTITSAPFQGRTMLLAAPPGTFDFLGLLPELRLTIYEQIMVSEESIKLRIYSPPGNKKRIVQSSFRSGHLGNKSDLGLWDPSAFKRIGRDSRALNLLLSCKTVHDEALPILYGMNSFRFEETSSLAAFKATINWSLKNGGERANSIRHIGFSEVFWTLKDFDLKSIVKLLKLMPSLRTVRFDHQMICPSKRDEAPADAEAFAELCLPVLKKMKEAQHNEGIVDETKIFARVGNIFSWSHNGDGVVDTEAKPSCSCPDMEQATEHDKAFLAKFKEAVAEKLA